MSDNKRLIPKGLSDRLFSLKVILYCVAGFVLYFVTGIFQSTYWFMHICIEWMNGDKFRWNYIEYDYLNNSLNFFTGMWINFKFLIKGGRYDEES